MKESKTYSILIKNKKFYYDFVIFLFFGLFLQIFYSHSEIVLWFNNNHTVFFNQIFIFFSFIGSGELFGIFLILMGIFRIKYLFDGLFTYLFSNLVTHIFKIVVDSPRPLLYFKDILELNRIESVELHSYSSFPSGHTTSAFVIFLYLSIYTKNKNVSHLYILMAIMVGLSRVYLLQHFFIDIYFGAIIAIIFSTIYYLFNENSNYLKKRKWYNYSLYNSFINVPRET